MYSKNEDFLNPENVASMQLLKNCFYSNDCHSLKMLPDESNFNYIKPFPIL